jgi:hypothetical protein
VAGEGTFGRRGEIRRFSPGVGGYVDGHPIELDHIKARRATAAGPIRDRPGDRDDETWCYILHVVGAFLMVVAAEHKFYSELAERVQSLLRVGQSVATGDRALYWVVVGHNYTGGIRGGALESRLNLS